MLPARNTLIGRLARVPLRLIPAMKPMRILSGPLAGKRWLSTSGTHGCWLGTYEIELQRLISRNVKPGQVFYDVGANVGFFSLLASTAVTPAGCVIAFEPLPRNIALLRANLALNDVDNVRLHESAVADGSGSTLFSNDASPSMGRMAAQEGIRVATIAIDALVGSGEVPPPQVMKMDIEGAESLALAGARHTLMKHRPLIYLSTHGFEQHEACCSFLQGIGYALQLRRDGVRDGQYELTASA
jgi:FkbM family methyltransferase